VRLWDPATGAPERTLEGHTNAVYGVCAVQVEGRQLLASAGFDKTVRLWDPATGAPERTLEGRTSPVYGVCAVQVEGRQLLASASSDGTVRIWDPATGAPERTETSSGSLGSPSRLPVEASSRDRLRPTSSRSGGGTARSRRWSMQARHAIVNPGGTGTPRLVISARFAPLPPRTARMSFVPSAAPSPKK